MYIDRTDGVISSAFKRKQYDGQKRIDDDAPELIAFLSRDIKSDNQKQIELLENEVNGARFQREYRNAPDTIYKATGKTVAEYDAWAFSEIERLRAGG